METNIVQQLLKGSAEIDRMRSEIDQIIAMMIGYLTKIRPEIRGDLPGRKHELDRSGFRFNHHDETWIVGRIADGTNRPFIEMEISPWEGFRTIYYSEWAGVEKNRILSAAHVIGIHAALPRLVEGLLKKYPELAQSWSPLLKAAEAE